MNTTKNRPSAEELAAQTWEARRAQLSDALARKARVEIEFYQAEIEVKRAREAANRAKRAYEKTLPQGR